MSTVTHVCPWAEALHGNVTGVGLAHRMGGQQTQGHTAVPPLGLRRGQLPGPAKPFLAVPPWLWALPGLAWGRVARAGAACLLLLRA